MKKVIFTLAVFLFQTNSWAQSQDITVYSDYGNQKPSVDARSREEDQRIINIVVLDTYSTLPKYLKDIATQVTYYVDHKTEITKVYMGYASEDDEQYVYPDKTFFNPDTNPNGTIKLNFTEKFVQACDFLVNIIKNNPNNKTLVAAARSWYRSVVAHELLHAYQYHTNPALDFERNESWIGQKNTIEGKLITFEDVVKGQRAKTEYERAAYELTMSYQTLVGIETLAQATAVYMIEHSDQFKDNGKYSLLNDKLKNPFLGRYMIEIGGDIKTYSITKQPGVTWIMTYEGPTRPMEILLQMRKIDQDTQMSQDAKAQQIAKLDQELVRFEKDDFWKSVVTTKLAPFLPKYVAEADAIAKKYANR